MSINDPNCIDIIATQPGTDVVRLIIADHLDWTDPEGHWRRLQEKLSAYVGFVDSGELARVTKPPLPATPKISIEVCALYPAPPELQPALDEIAATLAPLDIRFQHAHRPMPLASARGSMLQ